jgi:hypothetical protein
MAQQDKTQWYKMSQFTKNGCSLKEGKKGSKGTKCMSGTICQMFMGNNQRQTKCHSKMTQKSLGLNVTI